ncbi:uncharacterized protein LOC129782482 [Toxorhynchites rutilus septentrionalis]|uniref:uncharacterized protein LOC129782482 n=1 Tax=Toxorhynchites rutilus septentrionalis TaxID=329112 RepID=UPI0024788423|nr:uncharacterized protein LOC129782482 [Toxorhynchites rutilus septentrionalis]
MEKDHILRENILRQIREYQVKGYAHRASPEEMTNFDPRRIWFLPLGAVVNPKKPGKVRLIWDASSKVDGISLNTLLLKGPDELTSLLHVLFRFRQFPVAVTADIKEMFHQLKIRGMDKCAQLFLWRDDPGKQPDVAVFGATCSPAMAQYVKNVNAKRFSQDFPRAVEGIIQCHYVDDYLDSFLTIEEAKKVASEVKAIHKSGGFEIRGWGSNFDEIPFYLGEPKETVVKNLGVMNGEETERVLGMQWLTERDELKYSTEMRADITDLIASSAIPTKRQVLRCLMTLFDPLGLAAPYVVHGKILLQDIWRAGSDWDEPIAESSFERWQIWTAMLRSINGVRIPRSYFRSISGECMHDIQIHTFVDASPAAYACVSYLRVVNSDGKAEVALVAAKTKVAPLKLMTIPRLELQACVQGARLMKFVVDGHNFGITKRFLWTDSTVALSWINSDPCRFRPFVAHRVSEIQEYTQQMEWQWVPSDKNPADEASKWGVGPYFCSNSIWFSGPEFLCKPEDEWIDWEIPHHRVQQCKDELRSLYIHQEFFIPEPIVDVSRFSSWNRLHRSVAYVYRFIVNSKRNRNYQTGDLTQNELQEAEKILIRSVQWECFAEEMATLSRNQKVADTERRALDKTSKMYQLTPTLDEVGILRIDGRIGAASCASRDLKFPIILPKSHHLTHLIIDRQHRILLHANNETVVNEVRQRFHVPNLRAQVKKVVENCQYCRIKKAVPRVPQMAALPLARLSPYVRPFSYVGVDYFGPLFVKVGRSSVKRWVALFTCMTIRAVHVEMVHNLTTESCIRSVRRFVCRRGAPLEIHSDNATNFQGAERVLREQINAGLTRTFTSTTTKWRFIPPTAPHMGGAWERMVRSIETAIISAYNDERMNDESLHTLLLEAESLVNSRPLTYLPLDSEEQEALTPNHFLLGSSSGSKEECSVTTSDSVMLKQSWNKIQGCMDRFWSRWIREYLPVLTKRTKWFGETRNAQVDDLVLVLDDTRKNNWNRGRILEVITGKDGTVR